MGSGHGYHHASARQVVDKLRLLIARLSVRYVGRVPLGPALRFLVPGSRVHGFTGSRVRGFAGSRVHRFAGSQVRGFTGSRVRRFAGSQVHGFAGSRVHRFAGSRVHGFTGSRVHGFAGSQARGSRVHRFAGSRTGQPRYFCNGQVPDTLKILQSATRVRTESCGD